MFTSDLDLIYASWKFRWFQVGFLYRHIIDVAVLFYVRDISHSLMALARPHGVADSRRATSICATMAFTGSPSSSAAVRNFSQNNGSRLIDV